MPASARPEAARSRAGALARGLLPVLALAAITLTIGATLAVAGDTLGYDFHAYWAAGDRVLHGQALYDTTAVVAGPSGLYLYPPPFVLPILPLALLPVATATWVWIALTLVAFGVGTALLPAGRTVRWIVVLLAALSMPFVYATKLGQVGSILYLLFAIGWRWIDVPAAVGASGALGALVKVQPGIVLAWAALTRRWRAVGAGVAVLLVAAALSALVLGLGVWADFVTVLGHVSDPISTPHNFTPGAVAYQLGLSGEAAALVQWASTGAAVLVFVFAALRLSAVPSYLVAVVVSQLVSPIAWDHYAMLLLLPVAWLLERGRWWAVVIPLATSLFLVGLTPPIAYPLSYWATVAALLAVGARERSRPATAP